mmetsp:Transcript_27697/g.57410  ORF Transcript_27697/g.57410 Transcript_27697/m.57410 type:complete len:206 (+) Transcript_27697:1523-2140(+)
MIRKGLLRNVLPRRFHDGRRCPELALVLEHVLSEDGATGIAMGTRIARNGRPPGLPFAATADTVVVDVRLQRRRSGPPPVRLLVALWRLFAASHQRPSAVKRRTRTVRAAVKGGGARLVVRDAPRNGRRETRLARRGREVIGGKGREGGSARCGRGGDPGGVEEGGGRRGGRTTRRGGGRSVFDGGGGDGGQHGLDGLGDGYAVG